MYGVSMNTSSDLSSEYGSSSSNDFTYSSNQSSPNFHVMQQACFPFLRITEQPQEKFRYRYRSEKGSHGGLTGIHHTKNKKTYPTVKLENYKDGGSVYITARLFTSGEQPTEHVHELRGQGCEDGESRVLLDDNMIAKFTSISIQFTAKDDRYRVLTKRKREKLSMQEKDELENKIKRMNMNCVKLGFQAFVEGQREPLCPIIFSKPVFNGKSPESGDLKIFRISKFAGHRSGDDEVFLLCEKVKKDNIKVRFFESDAPDSWEADGNFNPNADVHHQVAIVFKTPRYTGKSKKECIEVYMELYRPSDGARSERKQFVYYSDDTDTMTISHNRKRKKWMIDEQEVITASSAQHQLSLNENNFLNNSKDFSLIDYINENQSMDINLQGQKLLGKADGNFQSSDNDNSNENFQSDILNMPGDINDPDYFPANFISDLPFEFSNNTINDEDLMADSGRIQHNRMMDKLPHRPYVIQGEMEMPRHPVLCEAQGMGVISVSAHPKLRHAVHLLDKIEIPCRSVLNQGDIQGEMMDQGGVRHSHNQAEMMDEVTHSILYNQDEMMPESESVKERLIGSDTEIPTSGGMGISLGTIVILMDYIASPFYNSAWDFIRSSYSRVSLLCYNALNFFSRLRDTERNKTDKQELMQRISYIADYINRLMSTHNKTGNSLIHVLTSSQGENLCFIEILLKLTLFTFKIVYPTDHQLQTSIHLAIIVDNTSLLKSLLEKVGKNNLKYYKRNTCLHIAAENNSEKCLKFLIESRRLLGIDSLDILNYEGLTPLHIAVKRKCVATTKLLIKGGANINYPVAHSGKTVLHLAVDLISSELVEFLLDQKQMNIDAKDCSGNTALHLSCASGCYNIAKILRNAKVDRLMPNDESQNSDVKELDLAADLSNLFCDDRVRRRNVLDCSAVSEKKEIMKISKEHCKETGSENWMSVECQKKICSLLDPPNGGWREFGVFTVDESDLDSIKFMCKSPTKQLLNLFKKNGGNVEGLKNILQFSESKCLKEACKIIEKSC